MHAHGIEALESRVLLSDTLTVNNTVVNSIAYPFMGVNYVEFWDSLQGSAAVQNALKNAGVQVIRFPGGAPGDWYQWDNSASWDVSNGGNNTSPLRLASFASAVGAKVLMQTNSRDHVQGGKANDPSGTHTAQYVSYMDANNAYVPYWEIGNEQDMDSINSSTWPHYDWGDYQWYMDRFNDQAAAMKAVDPTIKVMGPAGTNTWYWNAMDSLDMFLSKAGNRAGSGLVDAVSLHWYGGGDSAASWGSVESFAQGWNTSSNWQFIKSTIAQTDTRNLPVFVTEGNAADGAQGTGATMSYTLGSALANGDMVGALRDSGVQSFEWFGDLHGVYSPTYGGWGIFYGGGDHGTQETPSPKYFMLPIWSRAGNEQMSLTSSVSDTSTTLSAYAARATNGNIQVFIVNKTNAARTEDINLSNFAGLTGKAVKVYELKGATGSITDDTVIYNGVTNPTVTTTTPLPAPLDGGTVSGTTYSRTVPAYSLTMVEFQVNNANQAPVVRISSPADTGTLENNGPIVVSADAFDNDGTISQVEFYQGSTLLGTDTSSAGGWSINWTGAPTGNYTITAKAYDNAGATTTSAPVTITVVNRGGSAVSVPGLIQAETYNSGGQYIAFRDLDGSTPQTGTAGSVTYLTTVHNAEYSKYTVSVGTAGTYYIAASVANASVGGKFHINIDGVNVTGSMTVPYTGGATTWYMVGRNGISLSAGTHTMQFVVDSTNPATAGTLGNIDSFQIQSGTFTEATPAAPTVSGAAGSQLTNLSWNGVVGATSYNIYRGLSSSNLTLYQSGYTNTTFTDSSLTNGTTYYYQIAAVTQSGVVGTLSNLLSLTPTGAVAVTLPWQAADIGSPSLAGSSVYGGGAFTVSGAGGDIQGTADQCQFLYRQVSGDVTIIAQIISQTNTNEWAKAGPMIRQSLDAGAANAYTRMTPSHNAGFQFRTAAAGSSTDNVLANPGATPYWLKLVRSGSTFSGYISPDGATWTQIGSSQTITMTGNVYVGIAVTSHNTAQVSAATFINVSVNSSSMPAVPTLTATPVSPNQINLSWTNVTGESGYEIDRSSDGNNWSLLTTTAADVTTYNNIGLSATTTYYYRVRSYAGTSPNQIESDNSNAASGTTFTSGALPAPGNVTASAVSVSQINLSWSDVGTEDGYQVERSPDGSTGWAQIGTTGANVLTYSDTSLTGGTTYYYRVRAYQGALEGDYSTVFSATTLPTAPASLTAAATSASQINLSWTNVSGETGYRVERSPDGSTGWTEIATTAVDVVTYNDTGLTASTPYYYRVRAYNASGNGAYSPLANATALMVAPNVNATAASSSQINLSWNNLAGESGYKVERSPDGAGSWTQIGTTATDVTTYSDTGLTAGTTYYYRVRAYVGATDGGYSTVVSAITIPAAPGSLTATAASASQINLSWTDVSGETGYRVERSPDGSTGWTEVATTAVAVVTYNDTGLTAGTPYYYRVRAYNASGNGAYSPLANASTLMAAPTVTATAASATQVNLSWNNLAGESGYKVERSPDGISSWGQLGTTAADVTTYNDTNSLSAGTTYYYRVRAYVGATDGGYSTVVSAITMPAAPTSLTATATTPSIGVNLSWTNMPGETGYRVERSPDGSTGWAEVGTTAVDVVSYSDTSGAGGTTYYYRVRAYNTSGNGAYSPSASALTVPAAPVLTAAGASSTTIRLNWNDVTGETSYYVDRNTVATGGTWSHRTPDPGANVTTFLDSTTSGATRYYRVHGVNASGAGPYSNIAQGIAAISGAPGQPALVAASDTGSSTSDRITNLDNSAAGKVLQFTVASVVSGATVTLYDGSAVIGTALASSTSITITTNGTADLIDGSHAITAKQTEAYKGESAASTAQTVYIDTTAPTASVPDLNAVSDTGILNTDNITQGNAPQFDGTASDPTSGGYSSGVNRVTVSSDDGKSATDSTSPFYSASLAALNEGTRTVTATVYDVAGNSSTTSALALTVDRSGPTAAITPVWPDPCAGAVPSIAVGFSESVYGPAWSLFSLSRDGGANMLTSSQAVTGSGTSWSITNLDAAGITDRLGSYTLSAPATASITDAAGNALVGTASDTWLNTAMNLSGTNNKIVRNGANLDVYVNSATVTYSTPYAWYGQLAISGGSGDDSLTVSFANGANPVPAGGISFDGGTGANTLYLMGSSSLDPFTLTGAVATHSGSTVTFTNTQKLDLSGGAFTLNTNVLGKSLAISNGSLIFSTSQDVGGLNVAAGAMAKLAQSNGTQLVLTVPNAALFIAGTDAAPTGQIDLTNNMMVVTGLSDGSDHAAVAGRVRSLLQAGRSGGAWTGNGIASSTIASHAGSALGYNDTGTQSMVRYTWAGDANLDQTVNFNDLLSLAQHYGQTDAQAWQAGDFNYDGPVNFNDLLALAQHYGAMPAGLSIADLVLVDAPLAATVEAPTNGSSAPAADAPPTTASAGPAPESQPTEPTPTASQPQATQANPPANVTSAPDPATVATTADATVTGASPLTTPAGPGPAVNASVPDVPSTQTPTPTPAPSAPTASGVTVSAPSTSAGRLNPPARAPKSSAPARTPGVKVVTTRTTSTLAKGTGPARAPALPARKNLVAVRPVITGRPAPAAPALGVVPKNKRDPKVFEDRSSD